MVVQTNIGVVVVLWWLTGLSHSTAQTQEVPSPVQADEEESETGGWIDQLGSADELVRNYARYKLVQAQAVPELVAALSDGSAVRRTEVAKALGEIGDFTEAARRALEKATLDPVKSVREAASRALATSETVTGAEDRPPELDELIEELTHSDPYIRNLARQALLRHGATAVPSLVSQLSASSEERRLAAIEMLSALRGEAASAIGALRGLADTGNPRTQAAAQNALREIEGGGEDREDPAWSLEQLRQPQPEQRRAAIIRLRRLNQSSAEATAELCRIAREDTDTQVRVEAIHTLASLGVDADKVVPVLFRLTRGSDRKLRTEASRAISSFAVAAITPLLAALEGAGDAGVERISGLIWEVGKPAIAPLSAELAAADKARRVRAAQCLGFLGRQGTDAVPALARALRDPAGDVRRMAARSLGAIGADAGPAVDDLIELLRDVGRRSRREAAIALAAILCDLHHAPAARKRGDRSTQMALQNGLRWLAAHQEPEGSWDCDGFARRSSGASANLGAGHPAHDVGVTGLAVTAFLRSGVDGLPHERHPFREVVRRGLQFLLNSQTNDGFIGDRRNSSHIYHHAAATSALIAAAHQTRHPVYRAAAQRAIEFTARHRHPNHGWRYKFQGEDADTPVTTWMLINLRDAAAAGLVVDREAVSGGLSFIEQMVDPVSQRAGYREAGGACAREQDDAEAFPANKSAATTAMALLARLSVSRSMDPKAIRRAVAECRALPPVWAHDGSIDMVYWYYATNALYQAGGADWTAWRDVVTKVIRDAQIDDADSATLGSWDPDGPWGDSGGRIYSTATMLLILNIAAENGENWRASRNDTLRSRSILAALRAVQKDEDTVVAETARIWVDQFDLFH